MKVGGNEGNHLYNQKAASRDLVHEGLGGNSYLLHQLQRAESHFGSFAYEGKRLWPSELTLCRAIQTDKCSSEHLCLLAMANST